MIIGRSDRRMLIDCSISEYADLVSAAIDLSDPERLRKHPLPLHVIRPVSGLLAAHRDYAEELAPELVPIGRRSNAEEVAMINAELRRPTRVPPARSRCGTGVSPVHTAELIGAPVGSVLSEIA